MRSEDKRAEQNSPRRDGEEVCDAARIDGAANKGTLPYSNLLLRIPSRRFRCRGWPMGGRRLAMFGEWVPDCCIVVA